jgi:hypothetical protein
MAIIYVDSAAAGLNDGTSWTDAFTSITSADAAGSSAGDFIYVSKVHTESSATNLNFSGGTLAAPIKVMAIDSADDSLFVPDWDTDTLPKISGSSSVLVDGIVELYGLNIDSSAATSPIGTGAVGGSQVVFENCLMSFTSGSGELHTCTSQPTYSRYKNCTFKRGASTSRYIEGNNISRVVIEGGKAIGGTGNFYEVDTGNVRWSEIRISGLDLSVITGDVFTTLSTQATAFYTVMADSCLLGTGADYVDNLPSFPGQFITFRNCHIGTLTDPPLATCHLDYYGAMGAISSLSTFAVDVTAMTATYRTGGATDGVRSTPYCWPMIALASVTTEGYRGLRSLPLPAWVAGDGTSKTVTLYFAHGGVGDGTAGRLQDDQIWMDVYSGNDAAANSMQIITSTKPAPLATPADVTDDGASTWSGASVGTKQKLEATIAPDLEGPITVIVTFAPGDASDTTVFIDPDPEIA